MGLLRLIFIIVGLAVCSELPADEGVSFFRSYFAFFIMLALDYSRMAFKGVSLYEKIVGGVSLGFTITQVVVCWLGTGKQIVLDRSANEYVIVSSKTFGLLPYLHWPIHGYMLWTGIMTVFIAGFELTIPFVNRFTKKKENTDAADDEVITKPKSHKQTKAEQPGLSMNQNVPETITGGGK